VRVHPEAIRGMPSSHEVRQEKMRKRAAKKQAKANVLRIQRRLRRCNTSICSEILHAKRYRIQSRLGVPWLDRRNEVLAQLGRRERHAKHHRRSSSTSRQILANVPSPRCSQLSVHLNYGPEGKTTPSKELTEKYIPFCFRPILQPR